MTKKLYWESPYETTFSAIVDSIVKDGFVLDQTIFYPESGNQLSDRGILIIKEHEFKIKNVSKKEDNIIHHISDDFKSEISIGDEVHGEIDWHYRYGLMKAHSSQHVFSAVLKSKYNIDTIRANLNFEEVYLHCSQKIDPDQLKEILCEVNTICTTKNLKITSKIVPQEETEILAETIRSHIPKEPYIRLIEIKGLDLVCCGGTHVRNTTDIGNLFIFNFKKGNEIKYYVGNKATSIGSDINIDILTVVNELNSSIEGFRESITKRLDTLKNIQIQQKELSIKLLESISRSPSKIVNNTPFFNVNFNVDIKIINNLLGLFPDNSVLIVKLGNNKIRILTKSRKIDANQLLQKIIDRYDGKGGGSSKSAQAVLKNMPESLISEVERIFREMD